MMMMMIMIIIIIPVKIYTSAILHTVILRLLNIRLLFCSLLGISRCREDNIKMDLQDVGWGRHGLD